MERRRYGIRRKTVMIMLIVYAAAVFLLGTVFGFMYLHGLRQEREAALEGGADQVEQNLDQFLKNTDEQAYNVFYSTWFQKVFDRGITAYEQQKRISGVLDVLNSMSQLSGSMQIAVIGKDGIRYNSNAWFSVNQAFSPEKQKFFGQLNKTGKYVWSGIGQPVFYQNQDWCILVYYRIRSINTLDTEGTGIVRIPADTFVSNVLENVSGRTLYLKFEDSDGRVLYSSLPDSLKKQEKELLAEAKAEPVMLQDASVMVRELSIGRKEYRLYCILENRSMRGAGTAFLLTFLILSAVVAAVLLSVSAAFSRSITRPLEHVSRAMGEIADNHLGITVENLYEDEIGDMLSAFNKMSGSIADLVQQNSEIRVLQKEAEFRLLERQINPHFLFNNLELINALILNDRAREARTVCETLGELYHYNLRQDKLITLEEEMEYTQKYLFLMTYKVPNMTYYCDLEDSLREVQVPKVILQPLAENAIRHGFVEEEREWCITITACREDADDPCCDDILITVMDNGVGMEEKQLEESQTVLNRICSSPDHPVSENAHIGMKNVVQRLALTWENRLSVRLTSRKGYGTKIEIRIREEL